MSIFVLEQHYLSLSKSWFALCYADANMTLQETAAAQGSQLSTETGDKLQREWQAHFYLCSLANSETWGFRTLACTAPGQQR